MLRRPEPLTGRVAVITGGGRGIGRAMARAFAREGMRVAVGDLDGEAAAAVARELGPGAIGLPLDVTDRAAFTAFLDEVEGRLGPLDVLVNNAGIMPIGPFEEETDATTTRLLKLNVHAVVHGSREAVGRMRPRGRGHIVNLSSITGKLGAAGGATYAATKHAVVGLSESLRAELRGTGVRVTLVMPAFVRTELAAGTREIRFVRRVTPEEVAEAVVAALRTGRFEIYLPRTVKVLVVLTAILPRRVTEAIARRLSNDALMSADRRARAAYEARAAASAPAADTESAAAPPRPPVEA